jgi:hypothetical protein
MSSSTIRILDVPPEIAHAMPVPALHEHREEAGDAPGPLLARVFRWVVVSFRHVAGTLRTQRNAKAMRLCETISLGDKRFLAIVQVDEERILIGGSSSTVALLTRLPEAKPFSAVLLERSKAMPLA